MIFGGVFNSPVLYVFGAIVSLVILMASFKPRLWRVRLEPMTIIRPGQDILVPVGCFETRRMRVVRTAVDDTCEAIDIEDQRNHNGLAVGLAVAWPIMMPIVVGWWAFVWLCARIHPREVLTQQPRPRADAQEIPSCMQGIRW